MTPTCPSDLALEAHLLAPADSGLGDHLASCPACAARLETMQRQGEDFGRFVYPATVEKVEQAAERRRPNLFWLLAPAPVLAGVIGLMLMQPVTPPGEEYLGVKGGGAQAAGLTVFTRGAAGALPLADGAHLPAAAEVRFRVRNAGPCQLVVLSVDAAGQVSRLYRADDVFPPGQHDLEGGAVLDGKAGPERFYALCAGALPWEKVQALALQAAGGGADAVRGAGGLGGEAARLEQATVLLEKDAP